MNATIAYQTPNNERGVVVADKVAHVTVWSHGSVIHLVGGVNLYTADPVAVIEARLDAALNREP